MFVDIIGFEVFELRFIFLILKFILPIFIMSPSFNLYLFISFFDIEGLYIKKAQFGFFNVTPNSLSSINSEGFNVIKYELSINCISNNFSIFVNISFLLKQILFKFL